jgi:hypothetical protein
VVHHEEYDVILLVEPQQRHAQHGPLRQIEGAARLLLGEPPRLGLARRRGQVREVFRGQRDGRGRADDLHRPAVLLGEGRAQNLVAAHHLVERLLQRADVEAAVKAHGERHVVEVAARLQLVEEPEALLRERRRELENFVGFRVEALGGLSRVVFVV